MHSGKRGKSGSKRPTKRAVQVWLIYKPKEVELLIAKFAKEGKSSSEIGLILRDTYGIADVRTLCKKKISEVLKEKALSPELPDDLMALIRKSVSIRKHMDLNKKDETAKRGLLLTESLINRLTKFYKRTGKVASGWKYDPARAGFYTK